MTTIELITSIAAELDQMSVEMLESVSRNKKDFSASEIPVYELDEFLDMMEQKSE